jgi:hypothetical protein
MVDSHFQKKTSLKADAAQYFCIIQKSINTQGLKETLKWIKAVRLSFTRYLAGCPLERLEGVSLNKHGLPEKFYFLHKYALRGTHLEKRFLLTLLTASRALTLDPEGDLEPIISPWKGTLPEDIGRFSKSGRKSLGLRKIQWFWKQPHPSAKSGPNGHAILTSSFDADQLWLEKESLGNDLLRSLETIGGPSLTMRIRMLASTVGDHSFSHYFKKAFKLKETKHCLRRLTYISDKEGKTRTIAIFDYWSQSVLKPLHNSLMRLLHRIPEDCTFNQGS